ncbi:MAG: L-threonylcarbamoyladenylate synthase [Acidiferrobacterales bacterium]
MARNWRIDDRALQRDLARAAVVLQQGGIVAYATESCFGLGCNPKNRGAVMRLLRIKQRPASKGLILIAADTDQLAPFVADFPRKALVTWPGPYTWLLKATKAAPRWIRGQHASIAVRVIRHRQAAALCRAARMAIVSTSANHAGEQPARSYDDVVQRFGEEVDYVLQGRVGRRKKPTPIADGVSGKILRAG